MKENQVGVMRRLILDIRSLFYVMILVLAAVAFSPYLAYAAPSDQQDEIIGRGDGIVIKRSELEFFKKHFVPKSIVPTQEALLKVFLKQKLFALEAEKKGYDKRPDIQLLLRMERERVLGRALGDEYLKEHLNITDDILRSYYLSHIQEFKTPERFEVYKLVLRDKALMDRVAEEAKKSPKSFPELATKYSIDPRTQPKAGYMGLVRKDALIPKLKSLFEGAKKGDIIGPVELKGFYYLFWIKAVREAETKPFVEIKEQLYEKMARKKSSEVLDQLLQTLEEKYHFTWIKK